MPENRTHGSEGGEGNLPDPYHAGWTAQAPRWRIGGAGITSIVMAGEGPRSMPLLTVAWEKAWLPTFVGMTRRVGRCPRP